MADILRSLPYIVREGLKNVSIYIGNKLLSLKLTLTLSGVIWIDNVLMLGKQELLCIVRNT